MTAETEPEGIDAQRFETDREYRHWVTSVVLPSIRRHGFYVPEMNADTSLPDALHLYADYLRTKEDQRLSAGGERRSALGNSKLVVWTGSSAQHKQAG